MPYKDAVTANIISVADIICLWWFHIVWVELLHFYQKDNTLDTTDFCGEGDTRETRKDCISG